MKGRLDELLVKKNLFTSLDRARKAIMAGTITVNGEVKDKVGTAIDSQAIIQVKVKDCPYVSRGGLKLAKGLEVFDFSVVGKTFIDIGSSTGGFTDCLLQNKAKKVYAVDVGYGQLDWKLRNDDRVVCLERKNFRYLSLEELTNKADGSVMDVSFISIIKLLPKIKELTKAASLNLWLVKPQFEARREAVGEKGIIRDKKVHIEVLEKTITAIEGQGFSVLGIDYSPIHGQKGNIEFLLFAENTVPLESGDWEQKIKQVVDRAHQKNSYDKVTQ